MARSSKQKTDIHKAVEDDENVTSNEVLEEVCKGLGVLTDSVNTLSMLIRSLMAYLREEPDHEA